MKLRAAERPNDYSLRRAGFRPARHSGLVSLCSFSFASRSAFEIVTSFRIVALNCSNGCGSDSRSSDMPLAWHLSLAEGQMLRFNGPIFHTQAVHQMHFHFKKIRLVTRHIRKAELKNTAEPFSVGGWLYGPF